MDRHQENHDRIVQRGFAETLACQDMFARAPVRQPMPARALAWLRNAVHHRAVRELPGWLANLRVSPKAEIDPSQAP